MLNVTLVVVGGDAKAAEIRLKLPTTIGRAREATLTLPHPLVSRKHCEIFEEDGSLFVRDLTSLNGTYVNNTKIVDREALNPNQLLTIGNVTFRAVYSADAAFEHDTVPQGRMDTATDESQEIVELNDPKPAKDDELYSRPTKSGPQPAAASQGDTDETPLGSSENKPAILETIDANQLDENLGVPQHSVISAMADIDGKNGNGSVSLSEIDRLPKNENSVENSDAIDIHDENNPIANRNAQSFQGIELNESDPAQQVDAEDSRLGSFVKKFPR